MVMDNQNSILDAPPGGDQEKSKRFFRAGLVYVIAFYAAGGLVAALFYRTYGQPYIHAPGPHHFILFFTVAGGILWTIIAAIKALIGSRSSTLKGILVTHAVVLLSVAVYVYIIFDKEEDVVPKRTNKVVMKRDGDTTTLYHDRNLLYMKVRDSVLFNAIDSTNMPSDLVLVVEE